jgi:hypothetical protein
MLVKSIFQFFKNIIYWATGKTNKVNKKMSENIDVISAKYDNVIKGTAIKLKEVTEVHANLIAENEVNLRKREKLVQEIAELKNLINFSLEEAKTILSKYGSNTEAASKDATYIQCKNVHQNAKVALEEKENGFFNLNNLVEATAKEAERFKLDARNLKQEKSALELKKERAIDNIKINKQMDAVMKTKIGIDGDPYEKEKEELEKLEAEINARVISSREILEDEQSKTMNEFKLKMEKNKQDDEFDTLVLGRTATVNITDEQSIPIELLIPADFSKTNAV